MKQQLTRWMCLLLALLVLTGCGASVEPTTAPEESGAALDIPAEEPEVVPEAAPAWTMEDLEQQLAELSALGTGPDDNYRVWYEIFVYSFCDSDGDGIGDLQGVISKLDYLQELGINGIWLMPVHPSTSYHKYNVGDYYAIDPAYGTMEDMESLLDQCAHRGIRVILDLVVNHTGYDHVWFQTAAEYLRGLPAGQQPDPAACPYVEYYFFNQEGGAGYHSIEGSDWYFEGQFSPDMPDLNLDSPAVRQEIEAIMAGEGRGRFPSGCRQGILHRSGLQKCGGPVLASADGSGAEARCLSGCRGLGGLQFCGPVLCQRHYQPV